MATDPYSRHRASGAFLVIDPADGATLGAGMVGADLGVVEADDEEISEEDWLAG